EKFDFFHSRLAVNPAGTKLLSAGWIWHPFDTVNLYDVAVALSDPASLDRWHADSSGVLGESSEINSAAFVNAHLLLATSGQGSDDWYDDSTEARLQPGTIGLYDLERKKFLLVHPLEEDAGTLMPVSPEYAVGFYEHPKLIHVGSGRVLHRWTELNSGKQNSSIIWHQEPIPPLALDPANRRFAVADKEAITIITIENLKD